MDQLYIYDDDNKKTEFLNQSFVFHADWICNLTDDLKKEWLLILFNYAIYGNVPTFNDVYANALFSTIKKHIDFDLKKGDLRREYLKKYYEEKKRLKHLKRLDTSENVDERSLTDVNNNSYSNSNSNSNSNSYSNLNSNSNSNLKMCVQFWNDNADILGICTSIQNRESVQKVLEAYTPEYIKAGFEGFIAAVKRGDVQKRYIPKTLDTFILKNYLSRFNDSELPKSEAEKQQDIAILEDLASKGVIE